MTVAVIVLAVLTVVATAVAVAMALSMRRAQGQAREEAGRAGALAHRVEALTASSTDAEQRAGAAEQRLRDEADRAARDEADRAARDEAERSAGRMAPENGTAALGALWNLAALEHRTTRRAFGGASERAAQDFDLVAGLEAEVERIREEIGTPGTLRTSFAELAGPGAVVTLRAIEALLSSLARHCQAYDLEVTEQDGPAVEALVLCDDFSDRPAVGEDTAELRNALEPLGAELVIDRSPDGRLRGRLFLPVTAAW